MAGKVLTEDDFKGSGDPAGKDTSSKGAADVGTPAGDAIAADQKFDEHGKAIIEEPEEGLKPEGQEGQEGQEPLGGEGEPLLKPSDEKKYKYTSLDEYDKAYKEAERKMHEATTKAAEIERRLSLLEKPPEKPKTIDDRITEIANAAYDQINSLPVEYGPDGKPKPESLAKVNRDGAIIWAKANREIARLEVDESNKATESHRTTVAKLYERASKEGLKSDDELDMVGMAFDRTDPSLNLEDRVAKAVDTVKTRISRLREGFVQKQKTDKEEKDQLRVLGRGSTRTGGGKGKEEDKKPTTMSQQLAEMNESRRLKKEDLWQ